LDSSTICNESEISNSKGIVREILNWSEQSLGKMRNEKGFVCALSFAGNKETIVNMTDKETQIMNRINLIYSP
jgi:hypothetical protein